MIFIFIFNFHNFCEIVYHDFLFSVPNFTPPVKSTIMIFIFIFNFHNFCEIVYHDFLFSVPNFTPPVKSTIMIFIFIFNFLIPDEVAVIDFQNQFRFSQLLCDINFPLSNYLYKLLPFMWSRFLWILFFLFHIPIWNLTAPPRFKLGSLAWVGCLIERGVLSPP